VRQVQQESAKQEPPLLEPLQLELQLGQVPLRQEQLQGRLELGQQVQRQPLRPVLLQPLAQLLLLQLEPRQQ
jgi:hypothetical protein